MRRNGKVFGAGFKEGTQPQAVADVIYEAVTSPDYRLRWPVGGDAVGMAEGRPRISDEEFVAMGEDLSDEEYNGRFLEYFGVKL